MPDFMTIAQPQRFIRITTRTKAGKQVFVHPGAQFTGWRYGEPSRIRFADGTSEKLADLHALGGVAEEVEYDETQDAERIIRKSIDFAR